MFFSLFPSLVYDDALLVDLSRKIQAIELDDPKFLYDEYIVQNGERPDVLSTKFYGVPYYHWVLLVTNGLTLKTWPKSDRRFDNYTKDKYGSDLYKTAQYFDDAGNPVPYSFPLSIVDSNGDTQNFWFNGDGYGVVQGNDVFAVGETAKSKTNYELETESNDAVARIRILDKSFLGSITDLTASLLAG